MTEFGRSIYCSQFNKDKISDVCDFCFTSFHIAEEFNEGFKDKAESLIDTVKKSGKKLIVDLSPRGLEALGLSSIEELVKKYPIDYIRYDFGFSKEEIIEGSRYCGTVVNASTVDQNLVDELKGKILAIHNFYPREETGLDLEYFRERNQLFKEKNIPTGAFITGDKDLRGPLFEGLPTLEEHRFLKPYVQYLELFKETDLVIVGDGGLSQKEEKLIEEFRKDGVIRIPATLDVEYNSLYGQVFTNRIDSPKGLIRIKESREYATSGKIIEPDNTIERKRGSITIDNKRYLRYSGEMQVTKEDYVKDEKVNVIGMVEENYIRVLNLIDRGGQFCFVKGEEK